MCEAGNEHCLLSMIVETHRHSALSPINSVQVLGAMLTEISRALLEADVNIRLVKQLKDNVKVLRANGTPTSR